MAICYEIRNGKDETVTLSQFDEVCCNASNVEVDDESYCSAFIIYTSLALSLFNAESSERFQEIKSSSMIDKAKEYGYASKYMEYLIKLNALGYKLIAWRE